MDVHDEHGMPGTAVPAADAVQQPVVQPRTLLLVDDEPNILASLKRLLRMPIIFSRPAAARKGWMSWPAMLST